MPGWKSVCVRQVLLIAALMIVGTGVETRAAGEPIDADADWKQRWALPSGTSMRIDAEGFEMPTAIAFVPEPGDGPNDPLYYVTELRGTIKVVTNDRSVHVFAENIFDVETPAWKGHWMMSHEVGIAGLCLEPENGYLYITYIYTDAEGVMRNNITRFDCEPGRFSLKPAGRTDYTDIFAADRSSASHFIGAPVIMNGELYVGVGDGHQHYLASSPASTLGSILRMSLDGDPLPDNPFYVDDSRTNPRNYVYATGFRNPWGLLAVHGELFACDNGPKVDRFARVQPGVDYGYDGSDWSIGAHADIVFAPAVSPVSPVYIPPNHAALPEAMRGRILLAMSGLPQRDGPSKHGDKSLTSLQYDFENQRVVGSPRVDLKYRGHQRQFIVAQAVGPDGLYFAPFNSIDADDPRAVIRLAAAPDANHPHTVGTHAHDLMVRKGCLSCHAEHQQNMGPPLLEKDFTQRVLKRLTSEEYETLSRQLDQRGEEPFVSTRDARAAVREAEGLDKVRRWIEYRILEPRFDHPEATMPKLPVTKPQARLIANYLINPDDVPQPGWIKRLENYYRNRPSYLAMTSFALGAAACLSLVVIYRLIRRCVRGHGF